MTQTPPPSYNDVDNVKAQFPTPNSQYQTFDLTSKGVNNTPVGFEDYGGHVERVETLVVDNSTTLPQLTVNLATCCLGAGILSLPWTMAGASIFTTYILIIIVLCFNWLTHMVVILSVEHTQIFNLGDLLKAIPGNTGKFMGYFVNTAMILQLGTALVCYLVIITDCLLPLLPHSLAHRSLWIVIASCVIVPLCFLDQKALSYTSSISLFANCFMFIAIVLEFHLRGRAQDVCYLGFTRGSLTMLSTFIFAASMEAMVPPMYLELADRSPKRFGIALFFAELIVLVLFSAFLTVAYLTFGSHTPGDILSSFSPSWWGTMLRIMMIISTTCIYPLILYPIITPIRDSEREKLIITKPTEKTSLIPTRTRTVPKGRMYRTKFATMFVIVVVTLIGLGVSNIGMMNTFNGGICLAVMFGLCPCVTGLILLDHYNSKYWKGTMLFIGIFGVTMSVCAFVFHDNYAKLLVQSCIWPSMSKMLINPNFQSLTQNISILAPLN